MNYDSEEEMSEDDVHLNMIMEPQVSSTTSETQDETFPHEVLDPDQIVQHMIDCIKEVNAIVEVHVHVIAAVSSPLLQPCNINSCYVGLWLFHCFLPIH